MVLGSWVDEELGGEREGLTTRVMVVYAVDERIAPFPLIMAKVARRPRASSPVMLPSTKLMTPLVEGSSGLKPLTGADERLRKCIDRGEETQPQSMTGDSFQDTR